MVMQKGQGAQRIEEHRETAKSFFRKAFVSSMAIYPLKLDEIPSGYTSPILYIAVLASVNTLISLATRTKAPWDLNSMLLKYFWGVLTWLLYFLLACFVSSYVGAKIAKVEHSSKQFGLVVSSLTYIWILNILDVVKIDILAYVARLAGSLLMSYYIRESYRESITYQSARDSTIHDIWILVYCIVFPYINDATFLVTGISNVYRSQSLAAGFH